MLKKWFTMEPAVLIAFVAAVVAGAAQVQQAAAASGWWVAVGVAAPVVAGIVTRYHVVPAEAVRTAIRVARTSAAAVTTLADKVDVPSNDRPAVS